jgi:transcriptional regulator with XRE-family HTH domain
MRKEAVMDQIKIGKFIAERRKLVNLTQMQLAEKLNITDRAVSKWETGKSLPDSSVMLELCGILKITVNDLLTGEVVTMDNYNKEVENKLIEMVKEKEKSDKNLLTLEWVIGSLSTIVLLVPIIIASYVPMEDWKRILIIFSGVIPAIIGFIFSMKIEQVAGYYECKHCGHRYIPSFKAINFSMHMGRTRYMKCPECGKKSWQKKVINKD